MGLLLGGAFGWWIKPSTIIKNIITPVKNFSFLPDLDFTDEKSNDDTNRSTGRAKHMHFEFDSTQIDSTDYDKMYPDIDQIDSLTGEEIIGSVDAGEVTVKKDVLLFTKDLELMTKNGAKDKMLDSLLTDEESAQSKKTCRVEFWQSPINYKGYKFAGNKLTLFGIEDPTQTALIFLNNLLYLKNHTDYYPIEQTNNFLPLRKLNNASIIKQLSLK